MSAPSSRTSAKSEADRNAPADVELSDLSDSGDSGVEEYPTGFALATITFALCLAVFCVALDNTVRHYHERGPKTQVDMHRS